MNRLISKVRMTIERYQMLRGGEKVLVAVSGGADSICLLHVLLEIQTEYSLQLIIVHLNHGLRGDESLRDEAFIKNMAQQVNLPCLIARLEHDEYKKIRGASLQERARQFRYAFFNEMLEREQGDKIALGHNADDQAETLLIWLIRGAGTRGLSGIPPVREDIFIRPLIEVERNEIEHFLREHDIAYIQDSSNYENKYLRNSIRYDLIPYLKRRYNPQLISTLTQTSNILRAEDECLEEISEKYIEVCLIDKAKESIVLNAPKLLSFPLAIQLRILRRGIQYIKGNLRQITYRHIKSIIQLLGKTGSSKLLRLPGGIKATKEYNKLIIDKKGKESPSFLYTFTRIPKYVEIQEIKKKIIFSVGEKGKDISFADDSNVAYLDRSKVSFPMIIRPYKTGDWFYPTGMKGRKKVKDFFIDKKIPVSERLRVPLLVFADRIAWIGGLRVDRDMAANTETAGILKAKLIESNK